MLLHSGAGLETEEEEEEEGTGREEIGRGEESIPASASTLSRGNCDSVSMKRLIDPLRVEGAFIQAQKMWEFEHANAKAAKVGREGTDTP